MARDEQLERVRRLIELEAQTAQAAKEIQDGLRTINPMIRRAGDELSAVKAAAADTKARLEAEVEAWRRKAVDAEATVAALRADIRAHDAEVNSIRAEMEEVADGLRDEIRKRDELVARLRGEIRRARQLRTGEETTVAAEIRTERGGRGSLMASRSELGHAQTSAATGDAHKAQTQHRNGLPENFDMNTPPEEDIDEYYHSEAAGNENVDDTTQQVGEHDREEEIEDTTAVHNSDNVDDSDTDMLDAESAGSMSHDGEEDVLVDIVPLEVIPPTPMKKTHETTSPDIPDAPEASSAGHGVSSKDDHEMNDMNMPQNKVLQIEWRVGSEPDDDGSQGIPTDQSASSIPASVENTVPDLRNPMLSSNGAEERQANQPPVWKLRKTGKFYEMVEKVIMEDGRKKREYSENKCWLYARQK